MVVVIIADLIAIDIIAIGQSGVDILGGLPVGHDDDVILLAALLHGGCIGDTGIVPAVHAGKIEPGLGQGLRQRCPAVGRNAGDIID